LNAPDDILLGFAATAATGFGASGDKPLGI
jgi:hypothetical protein